MDMLTVDIIKQQYDDLTGTSPEAGSYRFAYPISLSERVKIQILSITMVINI